MAIHVIDEGRQKHEPDHPSAEERSGHERCLCRWACCPRRAFLGISICTTICNLAQRSQLSAVPLIGNNANRRARLLRASEHLCLAPGSAGASPSRDCSQFLGAVRRRNEAIKTAPAMACLEPQNAPARQVRYARVGAVAQRVIDGGDEIRHVYRIVRRHAARRVAATPTCPRAPPPASTVEYTRPQ